MVTIRNHNVILNADFTCQLHPKVLYQLGKISPDKQEKFKEIYEKRKRSLRLAFICLLFFPSTHYAFMGKWQMQFLFWITLGGCLIWWIADIFRLAKMVKDNNSEFQHRILREINSVNVFKPVKPAQISSVTAARVA